MKTFWPISLVLLASCGASIANRDGNGTALAECENLYIVSGEIDSARLCLEKLTQDKGRSASAEFLLGDLLDATGEPSEAARRYFNAVEIAGSRGGSDSVSIAASMAIVAIRDRVDRFDEIFGEFFEKLERKPGHLHPEALFQLRNLRFGLDRRKSKIETPQSSLQAIGCLTGWQTAGPFGPWTWYGADKDALFGKTGRWPAFVDLGPGRGLSNVQEISSDTCMVAPGDPAFAGPGRLWSRTAVSLDRPKTVLFRLQTGSGAAVRIGGKEMLNLDPRSAWTPSVSWFAAKLPAGATEISVLLYNAYNRAEFSLLAVDQKGDPAFTSHGPGEIAAGIASATAIPAPDDEKTITSLVAKLKMAIWWNDSDRTAELLSMLAEPSSNPSPFVLAATAEALTFDPSIPSEIGYERARRTLEKAIEIAPMMWQARKSLAEREISEERTSNALKILSEGIELCPKEPELRTRLIDLLFSEGWIDEANRAVYALGLILPSSCTTLAWRLVTARQLGRFEEALKLSKNISRCDASSLNLAEELTRAQRFDDAFAERKRLSLRSTKSAMLSMDLSEAALARGDLAGAVEAAKKATDLAPSYERARLLLADSLMASGDEKKALSTIEQGLVLYPGYRPALFAARSAIERKKRFEEIRVDGLAEIEKYRNEGIEYNTTAVFVLDRAVYSFGRNGSGTAVIHTITHLLGKEAIEKHGEVNLPEGAELLTARTIKSDGRILKPEEVSGKGSLSLPDLEPGDFIEVEYLMMIDPSPIFPGGFDTGRFYFQNFDTSFRRSEMIVIVPKDIDTAADARGPCPAPLTSADGETRTIVWRAKNVFPHPQEPASPAAVEYLPSIRVASAANWNNILWRMRDLLADKQLPSRSIADALAKATKGVKRSDGKATRRAIYRWVMNRIEPDEQLFEQASHIVERLSGNRARAFAALMQAAGYETRLALVKSTMSDETDGAAPDLVLFDQVAVLVPCDGWVFFGQDQTEYGYLPPQLRHRPAIFIDNGESGSTNGGSQPRDVQDVQIDLKVSDQGEIEGLVRETLTGSLAVEWRNKLENTPSSELKKRFQEDYLASAVPGGELLLLNVKNGDSPEKPLVLEYEIKAPHLARREGEGLVLNLPFSISLVKSVGGLPARTTPLVVAASIDKKVTASISLPDRFRAEVQQAEKIASREWGKANRWSNFENGKIRAGYDASLSADRIPVKRYVDFLEFARRIDRLSEFEIRIFAR